MRVAVPSVYDVRPADPRRSLPLPRQTKARLLALEAVDPLVSVGALVEVRPALWLVLLPVARAAPTVAMAFVRRSIAS